MLSNMESNAMPFSPDDPARVLDAADQARRQLIGRLRLPIGMYPLLITAVAVQLGTAAFGIAAQATGGLAVALGGAALFLGVRALLLYRFQQINGVSVDGLVSQVMLAAGASSLVYLGALAAAIWAAFASLWWLVAVLALVAGVSCALGTHHWWSSYRREPVAHTRGATPRVLAALGVVMCVGLVAALVFSR